MYAEVYDVMADTAGPDKAHRIEVRERETAAAPKPADTWSSITIMITTSIKIESGNGIRMMRNPGTGRFRPVEFPFVKGNALSGAVFRVSLTRKASTYC